MKLTTNHHYRNQSHYLIFILRVVTHLLTLQGLILGTEAYISPNSIFKRIVNAMTIEKVLTKEMQWEDAQLYASASVTDTVAPENTKTTNEVKEEMQLKSKPTTIPLKAESTALLIVDVQPEYWTHCPSVRKDFPNFESGLKHTIEICRRQNAKIIWVRADYRYNHSPWLPQFERLKNDCKRPDTKAEIPCDLNSDDFAWEEFATPEHNEMILTKKSWNSASNSALMDYLHNGGIENVLVCGLITSVCVQHSAFGVFEAGYRTLLVEDACADRGMARHQAAIALYGNYMYEVTTSKSLEDEEIGLQAAKPKWINGVTSHMKKRRNSSVVSLESSNHSYEDIMYKYENKKKRCNENDNESREES